jgi:hypothetical protein
MLAIYTFVAVTEARMRLAITQADDTSELKA